MSRSSGIAIEVRGLTKSFGERPALRGIDLAVSEGECLAVFGPNGAGKTTLIRVLATLSRPTSGSVRIGGFDLKSGGPAIRRRIGVIGHQPLLYENLTVHENLSFYAAMFDVPEREKRIAEVLALVGLEDRRGDRVGALSRGTQQRLAIARAILHDPPILLLDEPETGLDRRAGAIFSDLLRMLASGRRSVIWTTHRLDLGIELATRVIILHRGRIVFEAAARSLTLPELHDAYARCTGEHL